MTDYVVPSGVRIADAGRVRLGAHLAPGTVVMHQGFVNFNAGTLGASMVEGRISAGVVVGDGSDIGGGSSIMGTLSGGGSEVISVGRNCLLGANAGIGISLGDGCVVEAGCYVTSGTKVSLPDGRVVKARELSGQSGLLFWRNSVTERSRPGPGPETGVGSTSHCTRPDHADPAVGNARHGAGRFYEDDDPVSPRSGGRSPSRAARRRWNGPVGVVAQRWCWSGRATRRRALPPSTARQLGSRPSRPSMPRRSPPSQSGERCPRGR